MILHLVGSQDECERWRSQLERCQERQAQLEEQYTQMVRTLQAQHREARAVDPEALQHVQRRLHDMTHDLHKVVRSADVMEQDLTQNFRPPGAAARVSDDDAQRGRAALGQGTGPRRTHSAAAAWSEYG